jgi:cyclopropane fatty-acyl-phospholipid synthase-like methyltransferase
MFGPIFKRRIPITLAAGPGPSPVAEAVAQASHALPRLARRLSASQHSRVLDLGSVMGGNLQFFIDLGCKVTADDLLRPVETVLPDPCEKGGVDWKEPEMPRLDHPAATFDAVLAWDFFDFLGPAEARAFSRDLHRVVKPGGIVMAYFTSRQTERREPPRRYRILAPDRIEWIPAGISRSLRYVYQNRDIDKMFEGFRTHFAVVLKNGTREILLEKKLPPAAHLAPAPGAALP